MSRAVLLNPRDDVAVLVAPVAAGEAVEIVGGDAGGAVAETVTSGAALPLGHKVAVRALAEGALVRKYGEVIGRMTLVAAAGDHVHVHNLVSLRG